MANRVVDVLSQHKRSLAVVGPIYIVGVVWRVYHLFFAYRATELCVQRHGRIPEEGS